VGHRRYYRGPSLADAIQGDAILRDDWRLGARECRVDFFVQLLDDRRRLSLGAIGRARLAYSRELKINFSFNFQWVKLNKD
jgi:hypothetical protein